MGVWYDPDEIKDEAVTLKRQPEWDPKHDLLDEVFGDTEGGITDETEALIERANDIAAIVDGLNQ